MAQFRKKPVVIEAIRWTGDMFNLDYMLGVDAWMAARQRATVCRFSGNQIIIPTLEGDMTASPGDWIICGVSGELYPCKPEIFAMTYDPVEQAA